MSPELHIAEKAVTIKGLDEAVKIAREVKGSANYIIARTITKTAKAVQAAEKDEMKRVFDNPTPYTLGGVYCKTASTSNLSARVWLKDKLQAGKGTAAVDFLYPQVHGGDRQLKRFELALQYAGVLPRGFFAVPAFDGAAKKDRYGNMNKGQLVQILSYFRAGQIGAAGMTAQRKAKLARGTKTTRGFSYFAIGPGKHIPPGLYQKTGFAWGTSIKPVLWFVRKVRYEAWYDFYKAAQLEVNRVWLDEFCKAYDDAIRR